MAGAKKKIIFDEKTGEVIVKPGGGRPRKHPPAQPAKERPEGVPFVDRTGRPNPGAFTKESGVASRRSQQAALTRDGLVVGGKKMKSKEFRDLCRDHADMAFSLLWNDTISEDIAPRDRLNNVKFITAYAYGNPHTSGEEKVTSLSEGFNAMIAALEKREREEALLKNSVVTEIVDVADELVSEDGSDEE